MSSAARSLAIRCMEMKRWLSTMAALSSRLPLAAVGLMCMGLAACGWILSIDNFSPETELDASFVGPNADSHVPLDSQEPDAHRTTTESDAGLVIAMQVPPDNDAATADGSEPPPGSGDANSTVTGPVSPPDAQPDVSSETPCRHLLRCCADLILSRQLAAACVLASIADAGQLCVEGLGLLADAGVCR